MLIIWIQKEKIQFFLNNIGYMLYSFFMEEYTQNKYGACSSKNVVRGNENIMINLQRYTYMGYLRSIEIWIVSNCAKKIWSYNLQK